MTAPEAIEICRLKAEEINRPWCSEAAVATRRRVWPFPPFWWVVSRIKKLDAVTTMNVREATRIAMPVRVVYGASIPSSPVQPRLVFLFVFKLIVSGCLIWLIDRYPGGGSIWGATLIAIPGSLVGVIFYEGIVARIIRSKYDQDDEDDETDAA